MKIRIINDKTWMFLLPTICYLPNTKQLCIMFLHYGIGICKK